jgi:tetratricopeptide (TPR) repeat protein
MLHHPENRHRLSVLPLMAAIFLVVAACGLSGCGTPHQPASGPPGASSSGGSNAQTLKNLLTQGNAHAKARRWNDALDAFNRAIALNPDYAPAHVQAGWVYAEMKQWDEAKSHLIRAIALAPDQAGAHANLAWVYAEKKRWHDARQEAGKAIDLDPANAYAHATLAWAYQQTGQEPLAIAEYRKSVELKPDLENSHFALGMAYCNQGAGARAKEHLTHLSRLHSAKTAELQARLNKGCYPKK